MNHHQRVPSFKPCVGECHHSRDFSSPVALKTASGALKFITSVPSVTAHMAKNDTTGKRLVSRIQHHFNKERLLHVRVEIWLRTFAFCAYE